MTATTMSDENLDQPRDDETSAVEPEQADNAFGPSIEEQLRAAQVERDESKDRELRARAEFENIRRRLQKEVEQIRLFAAEPLARDIIPSLDNLRRAIVAAEATGNVEELLRGLQMVSQGLSEALAKHGVTSFASLGTAFDPARHEALQQMPSTEYPEMHVSLEIESGWQIHDRVLRPSRVIVSSGPPPAEVAPQ